MWFKNKALYVLLCTITCTSIVVDALNACTLLGECNGHGTCTGATKTCACYDGWGASTDVPLTPIAADCSERMCPMGISWADIPTAATTAHAQAECSGKGICQRDAGVCVCFTGYEGAACQYSSCLNTCSGHGQCISLARLSKTEAASPPSQAVEYGGAESTTTWDQDKIRGCLCDSEWSVGLASGETQLSEWFGIDCALRRCPSGDDPLTAADETDCEDKIQDPHTEKTTAAVGTGGAAGNLCHVSCSNRGVCDYATGTCVCFPGYKGIACGTQDALAGAS